VVGSIAPDTYHRGLERITVRYLQLEMEGPSLVGAVGLPQKPMSMTAGEELQGTYRGLDEALPKEHIFVSSVHYNALRNILEHDNSRCKCTNVDRLALDIAEFLGKRA
jgi:hypothetical protein